MTFQELGLSEDILKAIGELGFEKPMPIQEKVIPILLEKNVDITGLAQTGTGKTAAFGLPIIQQVDARVNKTQVLILSPTRELCMQIAKDLTNYSKYVSGLRVLAVYGGAHIVGQINELKRGVQIIVATPGRLMDLMRRKVAKLNNVFRVVLDEADEMLNMGFLDDINEILADVPKERNTLLFSATMPKEIQAIARKYMVDPIEIVAGTRNAGAENVKHLLYTVHAKDKYYALKRLADFYPMIYGIVFCRTRRETQEIADKLIQDGYNADSLHGDLSQAQRDYVMQKFRIRNIRLLVATDVAARGLDVNDLTHVIHYSLPDDKQVYTHRSGRTGRIGKSGISIAITHLREKFGVSQIEKQIGIKFIKSTVPTGREICEKQLFNMIDKMENVKIDHSQIDTYLPVIYKKLEWLDKEELIKRFVSLEFNRFLNYYRDADKLSEPTEERGRGRRDRDRGEKGRDSRSRQRDNDGRAEQGYTRIFINLGKMDGLVPNGLIEMINKNVEGPKIPVGRIDLMKKFSFFEVKSDLAKKLIKALNRDTHFRGSRVAVELAQGKDTQEKKAFTKRVDGARKKRKRRF
ncbi:MAG: DEAD/DEAH box helicase [Bacteroidetes bacterium 4572_114]|nr:MAG: DEAD/DEAH box helicase [Bacteroidetes bacterium 4572_114]